MGAACWRGCGVGKGFGPLPHPISVGMRKPQRADVLGKKGWGTKVLQQLQLLLPVSRAVRIIVAPKAFDSVLGVMSVHGAGKLQSGVLHHLPHQ